MLKPLNSLKGKTALITGGAKRIGKAISIALAEAGVNIVIHYKDSASDTEDNINEIKKLGVEAHKAQADLSKESEVSKLFGNIYKDVGKIDYLINSASIFYGSKLDEISVEDMKFTFDINSIAPMLLARSYKKQTDDGVIINFLDTRISKFDLSHVSYQLSKKLLFDLTKIMAIEYAPGIRVNAIAPGLILPPEGKDESYLEKLTYKNLLDRMGNLSYITDTVLFLLSNEFITGECIYVDGGENLKGLRYDREK